MYEIRESVADQTGEERMRQELSTQTIAIIAVALAVGSALFCVRWALRYRAMVQRYESQVLVIESKQDDLKEQVLNFAALLLKSSEETPRSHRLRPANERIAQMCDVIGSSITLLREYETVRADLFLLWYHEQMERRHLPKSNQGKSPPVDAPLPLERPLLPLSSYDLPIHGRPYFPPEFRDDGSSRSTVAGRPAGNGGTREKRGIRTAGSLRANNTSDHALPSLRGL